MKNSNQYELSTASLNCFTLAASRLIAQMESLSTFSERNKTTNFNLKKITFNHILFSWYME